MVELLLSDPRVDPSADNNYSIRFASLQGHCDVVDALLTLGGEKVDPAADDNMALQCSVQSGHKSVVKRLLLDSRVDPNIDCPAGMLENDSSEIFKLLQAHPRFNKRARD